MSGTLRFTPPLHCRWRTPRLRAVKHERARRALIARNSALRDARTSDKRPPSPPTLRCRPPCRPTGLRSGPCFRRTPSAWHPGEARIERSSPPRCDFMESSRPPVGATLPSPEWPAVAQIRFKRFERPDPIRRCASLSRRLGPFATLLCPWRSRWPPRRSPARLPRRFPKCPAYWRTPPRRAARTTALRRETALLTQLEGVD